MLSAPIWRYTYASAITVIDSETTKVIATFKSNFITMPELADLIYQFVSNYAKNAIVCVENNGDAISSQTAAYRVTCRFHRVKCYEEGQELYTPQRDLQRCAWRFRKKKKVIKILIWLNPKSEKTSLCIAAKCLSLVIDMVDVQRSSPGGRVEP